MVGFVGAGLLLLAPGNPAAPPPPVPATDRTHSDQFARTVFAAAHEVGRTYVHPVEVRGLVAGAVRGLFEEAGRPTPDDLLNAAHRTTYPPELLNLLADAHVRVTAAGPMTGPRAVVAAVNGFRHATDPFCELHPRSGTLFAADMDFGVGLELAGVSGQRWNVYRVEHAIASGTRPAAEMLGPVPALNAVPSPAGFPWRVLRVVPGSPAHQAGVKPGDTIAELDGEAVTAASANRLFARFAFPFGNRPETTRLGRTQPKKWALKLTRAGAADPLAVTLEARRYTPEQFFGVIRLGNGEWDYALDRANRICYLRLGAFEDGTGDALLGVIDDLKDAGCRGLVLDLRWCPGGWTHEGAQIVGVFLKPNATICVTEPAHPAVAALRPGQQDPRGRLAPETYRAASPPRGGLLIDPPIVVLTGPGTTGTAELVVAALRDNNRCVVMGQRTAGRGGVQYPIDIRYGGLQYRLTSALALRPNGQPRAKAWDSRPTDNWGIRPDPGLEVPVTPDLSARLRAWAEEHALRPADSQAALPFDDPATDPARAAALAYLRKQLGPPDRRE